MTTELLRVIARDGSIVDLDISDEACLKFGFRHGNRVVDPDGDVGIVLGVASDRGEEGYPKEVDVLYYRLEQSETVVYWSEDVDLRGEGFRLINNEALLAKIPEALSDTCRLETCMRVIGDAGAAGTDEVLVDMYTVCEQERIFKCAGYMNVRSVRVMVLFGSTNTGYVFEKEFIRAVTINRTPVSAKYSRVDIYPGMKVRIYDRDVLKRTRATSGQLLVALVSSIALLLIPCSMWVIFSWMHEFVEGVIGLCTLLLGMIFTRFGRRILEKFYGFGEWVAGITPL